MPVYQQCLCADVLACQHALHANVPKECQLLIFMYQRSNECAKVPNHMPVFWTFLLQNDKGNFYTWNYYIKNYT